MLPLKIRLILSFVQICPHPKGIKNIQYEFHLWQDKPTTPYFSY